MGGACAICARHRLWAYVDYIPYHPPGTVLLHGTMRWSRGDNDDKICSLYAYLNSYERSAVVSTTVPGSVTVSLELEHARARRGG